MDILPVILDTQKAQLEFGVVNNLRPPRPFRYYKEMTFCIEDDKDTDKITAKSDLKHTNTFDNTNA